MRPQRLDAVRAARRMAVIEQVRRAAQRSERRRRVAAVRRSVG